MQRWRWFKLCSCMTALQQNDHDKRQKVFWQGEISPREDEREEVTFLAPLGDVVEFFVWGLTVLTVAAKRKRETRFCFSVSKENERFHDPPVVSKWELSILQFHHLATRVFKTLFGLYIQNRETESVSKWNFDQSEKWLIAVWEQPWLHVLVSAG